MTGKQHRRLHPALTTAAELAEIVRHRSELVPAEHLEATVESRKRDTVSCRAMGAGDPCSA
jgi:hypothetical protein